MMKKRLNCLAGGSDSDTGVFEAENTKLTNICTTAVGHGFRDLPMAAGTGKHPVVLGSHGLPSTRKLGSSTAEELASHGYVVVATDHSDCWATEFPDGRYLAGNHSGDVTGRLKDMQFLLDELAVINTGDPLFAGRLDLDRIGVSGGSYGGMLVETCRSDSRVKCAVLYDVMNVRLNPTGLQKPFLVALGESNAYHSDDQWLFSKATTNAVFLQIGGAGRSTPFRPGLDGADPLGPSPRPGQGRLRSLVLRYLPQRRSAAVSDKSRNLQRAKEMTANEHRDVSSLAFSLAL